MDTQGLILEIRLMQQLKVGGSLREWLSDQEN